VNESNSGNVFRQWKKGIELAKGELVWIAEADDSASSDFLSTIVTNFKDSTVIGYSDSEQIDENDNLLGESYKFYYDTVSKGTFNKSFHCEGSIFAADYLSIKNIILNVSSVVFDRASVIKAIDTIGDELFKYKVAGDWRIYVELLKQNAATIFYSSKSLNIHRRHSQSVTHSNLNDSQLKEIKQIQTITNDFFGEKDVIIDKQSVYNNELIDQVSKK
jgi:hypothetical protein